MGGEGAGDGGPGVQDATSSLAHRWIEARDEVSELQRRIARVVALCESASVRTRTNFVDDGWTLDPAEVRRLLTGDPS